MKRILIILLGILAIAAITNPSEEDYRASIKLAVREQTENVKDRFIKPKKKWQEISLTIGYELGSAWLDSRIDKAITKDDYVLCSLVSVNVENQPIVIGAGAFGQVWLVTDVIEIVKAAD
jgi:hypothetical protein